VAVGAGSGVFSLRNCMPILPLETEAGLLAGRKKRAYEPEHEYRPGCLAFRGI
jgi:hypothetical protein